MRKVLSCLPLSVLAGFLIGLGGFTNLFCVIKYNNPVAGAIFFCAGLTFVCFLSCNLFTGKVGYIFENKLDNLIIIRGGITKDKSMDAVNIVKKILKDLEAGKIDDDRIEKAKEYYTSAIDDIVESPFQIIESYYMIELLGVDDIETKRKKMLKVTKDEIIAVAKKVKINTVYILEGSDDNGEN